MKRGAILSACAILCALFSNAARAADPESAFFKDKTADFETKGQPIQYAPPEEILGLIDGLLGAKITPERLREIRHVVLDKYY